MGRALDRKRGSRDSNRRAHGTPQHPLICLQICHRRSLWLRPFILYLLLATKMCNSPHSRHSGVGATCDARNENLRDAASLILLPFPVCRLRLRGNSVLPRELGGGTSCEARRRTVAAEMALSCNLNKYLLLLAQEHLEFRLPVSAQRALQFPTGRLHGAGWGESGGELQRLRACLQVGGGPRALSPWAAEEA